MIDEANQRQDRPKSKPVRLMALKKGKDHDILGICFNELFDFSSTNHIDLDDRSK